MKYLTSIQQQDALKKQGFLELEALFSIEEAHVLKTLLDDVFALRLGITKAEIHKIPEQTLFNEGYELQRGNIPLKKAMKLSKLGQIGSGLFREKNLCLAFTQYYPCFHKPASLKEISSLSEICGGAFIGFSSSELTLAPHNTGNVVFFTSDLVLPFPDFNFPLLLMAFTNTRARYILQPNDPHTHFLKKLGYVFGDKITTETHPLIFRE